LLIKNEFCDEGHTKKIMQHTILIQENCFAEMGD